MKLCVRKHLAILISALSLSLTLVDCADNRQPIDFALVMKEIRVSESQLNEATEAIHEAYDNDTSKLSDQSRIDEFDRLYDDVVSVLRNHGSFSDGGLEEADFASSRYVDPSPVLVVVNSNPVSPSLKTDLVFALAKLRGTHAVVFDGVEVVAVFSDGRILTSS